MLLEFLKTTLNGVPRCVATTLRGTLAETGNMARPARSLAANLFKIVPKTALGAIVPNTPRCSVLSCRAAKLFPNLKKPVRKAAGVIFRKSGPWCFLC
jgi:hypothetical protein